MKLRPKKAARQNASRILPPLVEAFLRNGDAAFEDALHGEELHEFRIQTKRLRYVLEYFRPCYGQALEAYLKTIQGLQTALGDLNDCCSTRTLLQEVMARDTPHNRYKKLFAALDRREQNLFEEYRAYWTQHLEDAGYRQKFLRYLRNPPRTRERKK